MIVNGFEFTVDDCSPPGRSQKKNELKRIDFAQSVSYFVKPG